MLVFLCSCFFIFGWFFLFSIFRSSILSACVLYTPLFPCLLVLCHFIYKYVYSYIKENNIGKGTVLSITRSGDVIPHILSVISSTEADLPTKNCHWRGVDLISDDDNTKTQFISRMVTLFENTDIKGMKEGILTKLYDSGITTEHSLFNINKKVEGRNADPGS